MKQSYLHVRHLEMVRFAWVLFIFFMAGTMLTTPAAETPAKPNIVFMLADDLGWQDVGFNGSKIRTPNIDQLAKDGVRLNQFYAQPICSPTRSSLMTGRYPMRYGMQIGVIRPWAKHGLPLDERTLAQGLSGAGYETAVVGKWHLGHLAPEYLPTRRGFDHQYGHYNGALGYFTHVRDGGHDWHRNDKPVFDEGYATDLLAKEAIDRIAKRNKDKPLFLYVPFNAVHTPLQVPESYSDQYAHMSSKRRQVYAGMVASLDEAVGKIMQAIKEHDLSKNTLVFFCSDNGGIPSLGSNFPLRAGKDTLYEGGVRVVAAAAWPGVLKAGTVIDEPMHIVDMYPTLMKLAGAELARDKPIDGKDVWPVLTRGATTPHEYISHNSNPDLGAIRMGDWKLIHNGQVRNNTTQAAKEERYELFNIRTDPGEEHDVKEEHSGVFRKMKKKLKELAAEAVAPNVPPNRPPKDFKSPKVWGHPEW